MHRLLPLPLLLAACTDGTPPLDTPVVARRALSPERLVMRANATSAFDLFHDVSASRPGVATVTFAAEPAGLLEVGTPTLAAAGDVSVEGDTLTFAYFPTTAFHHRVGVTCRGAGEALLTLTSNLTDEPLTLPVRCIQPEPLVEHADLLFADERTTVDGPNGFLLTERGQDTLAELVDLDAGSLARFERVGDCVFYRSLPALTSRDAGEALRLESDTQTVDLAHDGFGYRATGVAAGEAMGAARAVTLTRDPEGEAEAVTLEAPPLSTGFAVADAATGAPGVASTVDGASHVRLEVHGEGEVSGPTGYVCELPVPDDHPDGTPLVTPLMPEGLWPLLDTPDETFTATELRYGVVNRTRVDHVLPAPLWVDVGDVISVFPGDVHPSLTAGYDWTSGITRQVPDWYTGPVVADTFDTEDLVDEVWLDPGEEIEVYGVWEAGMVTYDDVTHLAALCRKIPGTLPPYQMVASADCGGEETVLSFVYDERTREAFIDTAGGWAYQATTVGLLRDTRVPVSLDRLVKVPAERRVQVLLAPTLRVTFSIVWDGVKYDVRTQVEGPHLYF